MKTVNEKNIKIKNRKSEEGAALVMVLLISVLLLVGGGALLISASMNSGNMTDAVADQQAYYASESGLQSTINVLRRNTVASPLLDATKPANDPVNTITYKRAVVLSTSNAPTDTAGTARLSRWMSYNGVNVTMGPAGEFAYTVQVLDPDDTINRPLNVRVTSTIMGNSAPYGLGNGFVLDFEEAPITNVDVSSGSGTMSLGHFVIRCATTQCDPPTASTTIPPPPSAPIQFAINVRYNSPIRATRTIRGRLLPAPATTSPGLISKIAVGNLAFDFYSIIYDLGGSKIEIQGADSNKRIFPSQPVTNVSRTEIRASLGSLEPQRLVVRSTGFGPRGAQKQLEAVVQKDLFNGLGAMNPVTMVGNSNGFVFQLGNSNATTYSGNDTANTGIVMPPIGVSVTGTNNQTLINSQIVPQINNLNPDVQGYPADITDELPHWLETTTELDATINALRRVAASSGTYYPSGQTPPTFGTNSTGTGITFVDGNVRLEGSGGGILVCTGTLVLKGNFNFNGVILVTGAGGVTREGGGNGTLQGSIIVSPYNPSDLGAGFLGPKYDLNGGGASTVTFNSNQIYNGLTAVDNLVLGVAEK